MLRPIHSQSLLEWVQPDAGQAAFEVRAEHELVGTLQQCQPGGEHFFAQAAEGAWTFTWCGLLRPQVLITQANEAAPLALLRTEANSGTCRLKDGRAYTWLSRKGWVHDGLWTDDQACVLTHLSLPVALAPGRGQVVIAPAASGLSELSLLILLGGYLLVCDWDDFLRDM